MKNIFMTVYNETKSWCECLINNFPGQTGLSLRRIYWSNKLKVSYSFNLATGCTITGPQNIIIGRNANIMHNCSLHAHNNGSIRIGDRLGVNTGVILSAADDGEIIIGNDVLIGPNVVIRASNHFYNLKDIPINKQGHGGGKIIIEDDIWIGTNSVILPGSIIRRGAVIAAGTVVNGEIPAYALAAGVPAKVLIRDCRV